MQILVSFYIFGRILFFWFPRTSKKLDRKWMVRGNMNGSIIIYCEPFQTFSSSMKQSQLFIDISKKKHFVLQKNILLYIIPNLNDFPEFSLVKLTLFIFFNESQQFFSQQKKTPISFLSYCCKLWRMIINVYANVNLQQQL